MEHPEKIVLLSASNREAFEDFKRGLYFDSPIVLIYARALMEDNISSYTVPSCSSHLEQDSNIQYTFLTIYQAQLLGRFIVDDKTVVDESEEKSSIQEILELFNPPESNLTVTTLQIHKDLPEILALQTSLAQIADSSKVSRSIFDLHVGPGLLNQ